MKYAVSFAGSYKRNRKKCEKRGLDISLLDRLVEKIANGEKLDPKYCDHQLVGFTKGTRECHIKPDWLLIYLLDEKEKTLVLINTGTHSDIFK